MVLIRQFLFASAVAIFVSPASAQVFGPGGSGGALTCMANAGNPTQVRTEGFAEWIGDIAVTCTGGSFVATVGTANITVAITNTLVTSKVFPNGLSEALLLID